MEGNELFCPQCKGKNIVTGQRGFSLGKAAVGGIILGPLGLLAGTHKSKAVRFTCIDCGHTFSIDDLRRENERIRDERLMANPQTIQDAGRSQTRGYKALVVSFILILIFIIFLITQI